MSDIKISQIPNFVEREFNGKVIRQRNEDGYFDATAMCRATGKHWKHYNENANSKAFVEALSSEVGIPTSLLIESKKGNTAKFDQGTWVHPYIAINLAQWCSPQFAVQVSKWVFELMNTGKVELETQVK